MPTPMVLLVDEDQDSLTIYSLILEHHGYQVLLARGGEEAVRLTTTRRFDVVVTEINVTGVQGRSLAEHLKQGADTAAVPILAVTSFPVKSGWHSTGLAHCDAFLAKPCAPSRLLAEVERLTSKQQTTPLPHVVLQ